MKLTAGELYDAQIGLASIIRNDRAMPQIAKFKVARMHTFLEPYYKTIEDRRIAAVQQFGEEQFHDEEKTKSKGWGIAENSDAMKLYLAAWDAIRAQEMEVNIHPLTLQLLGDSENGPAAGEFKMLGPLVINALEEAELAVGVPVGTA
jgi:hypothetical protein